MVLLLSDTFLVPPRKQRVRHIVCTYYSTQSHELRLMRIYNEKISLPSGTQQTIEIKLHYSYRVMRRLNLAIAFRLLIIMEFLLNNLPF